MFQANIKRILKRAIRVENKINKLLIYLYDKGFLIKWGKSESKIKITVPVHLFLFTKCFHLDDC